MREGQKCFGLNLNLNKYSNSDQKVHKYAGSCVSFHLSQFSKLKTKAKWNSSNGCNPWTCDRTLRTSKHTCVAPTQTNIHIHTLMHQSCFTEEEGRHAAHTQGRVESTGQSYWLLFEGPTSPQKHDTNNRGSEQSQTSVAYSGVWPSGRCGGRCQEVGQSRMAEVNGIFKKIQPFTGSAPWTCTCGPVNPTRVTLEKK